MIEIKVTDFMDETNELSLLKMFGLINETTQGDVFKIDLCLEVREIILLFL